MLLQPAYAVMAKSGNEIQYLAYVNPFHWVKINFLSETYLLNSTT